MNKNNNAKCFIQFEKSKNELLSSSMRFLMNMLMRLMLQLS